MFKYFDSHSHLNLEQFLDDKDAVIQKMKEESVGTLTVGIDFESSKEAIRLAKENENLFACVGLHPHNVESENFDKKKYKELLGEKTVCVGECGFDFYRGEKNIEEQEKEFRSQIEFAIENDIPLMLHIRSKKGTMDAYEETLRVLEEYKDKSGEKLRGQAHFFAGDKNIAQRFLDLGFYISFTGVVTFTKDYDEVVKMIPDDRILCETDAPYVSPEPYRGHRCEPQWVIEVYKKIAEIRGISEEDFVKQVRLNIGNLYNNINFYG